MCLLLQCNLKILNVPLVFPSPLVMTSRPPGRSGSQHLLVAPSTSCCPVRAQRATVVEGKGQTQLRVRLLGWVMLVLSQSSPAIHRLTFHQVLSPVVSRGPQY